MTGEPRGVEAPPAPDRPLLRLADAAILWRPKGGHADSEWEDAARASERRGRLALADGAASSPRAFAWADHLTSCWIERPSTPGHFDRWLPAAIDTHAPATLGEDAHWYQAEAACRPSFATFVGVELRAGSLRAVIVGDSCLFHVRHGRLLGAWPIDDPDRFTSTPDLVSDRDDAVERAAAAALEIEVAVEPGDRILIASDALSQAALRVGGFLWSFLGHAGPPAFETLVSSLRRSGQMVNDDVTLVRAVVTVAGPEAEGSRPEARSARGARRRVSVREGSG